MLLLVGAFAAVLGTLWADDWASVIDAVAAGLPIITTGVGLHMWHRKVTGRIAARATEQVLKEAKAELASAGLDAWQAEAQLRDQDGPQPMPVVWQVVSAPEQAEHVVLPGATTDREATRRQMEGFAAEFSRWTPPRLVIVGNRGSGKTTFAMQLTLALLAPARGVGDEEPTTPRLVPVFLSAAGWSPERSFAGWVAEEIARICPEVSRISPDMPRRLVDRHHVVIVLDGLDEIPAEMRAKAFEVLDATRYPLVLTCRTEEFEASTASRSGMLSDAHFISPRPLTTADAAAFLRKAMPRTPAPGWEELLTELEAPGPHTGPLGVLAEAVTTPLDLGLLKATYAERSPRDLLRPGLFDDQEALRGHLFDELIPKVLEPPLHEDAVPDWLRPRHHHHPVDVRRWLGFLADCMDRAPEPSALDRSAGPGTRDLLWWRLASLTLSRRALPWAQVITWALLGAATGALIGTVSPTKDVPDAATGAWGCLFLGAVSGGVSAFFANRSIDSIPRFSNAWYALSLPRYSRSEPRFWRKVGFGALVGAPAGAALVVAVSLAAWIWKSATADSPGSLMSGESVLFGLNAGVVVGSAAGLAAWGETVWGAWGANRSGTPLGSLRADRDNLLLTLALIITAAGSLIGWMTWDGRSDNEATLGVLFLGLIAVGVSLFSGERACLVYAVAVIHAWWRGHLPLTLMRFLDDAHRLNLLRAVGPAYQFRHAEFQDHLAAWYRETYAPLLEPTPSAPRRTRSWRQTLALWVLGAAVFLGAGRAWELIDRAESLQTWQLVRDIAQVVVGLAAGIVFTLKWRQTRRATIQDT
ncbi:NACHT domain-containing NTPase [Streptomyces sp. TLI_185]|uniref:NACHT domain-containing protein n=1 Tax=Streptomyces sp. TLI_185 TaxID=2485151 RepID=UPI000F4DF46E|nr:NACHT domain-containing protein [Streptomyces sp. TLI_185]